MQMKLKIRRTIESLLQILLALGKQLSPVTSWKTGYNKEHHTVTKQEAAEDLQRLVQ